MKQTIVLLLFGIFLTSILCSYETGPAANGQGNLTGATGAGGCTCHNATAGIGTTVQLDSAGVLVTSYRAGGSYTVKITATNNTGATLPNFGFQLSTVKLANAGTGSAAQAGTWGTATNTHNTATGSCSVMEQSTPLSPSSGTGGNGTVYTESIPWTAPVAGTGSIKIYGVINAVNRDFSSSGDNYQLASAITITEAVAAPIASVNIAITSGSNPACASSNLTFTATPTNGGTTPTYQWEGNGVPIPGATSAVETLPASSIPTGTVVTCVMTSNLAGVTGSPATSNSITMTITPNVTPSVTISSPNTTICAGSPDTFTAVPTNGGTPSYQWLVNGSNAGTNSSRFITSTLTNGQTVTCVMTSTASCASPLTATSNPVTVTVTPTVTPSVSISAQATTICAGTLDSFTAVPTNGGTPSYQWKVNGTNAGTNSPIFATSTLTNGQVVTCVMTSTATCPSPATAVSNQVTIAVNPTLTPSVTITATSANICTGAADTFTAVPTNGGTSPSYQWKVNGTNAGSNSPQFITSALTNGQVVTCVLTSNAPCATTNTATSNQITISVGSQTPTITISPRSASVCSGSPDTFTAVITNGGSSPSYQWKINGTNAGINSGTFVTSALTNGQIVTCVLTSSLACASPTSVTSNSVTASINALVTPTLTISTLHDTICQGTSDTFTAVGTNLGTSPTYQWQITGANTGPNSPTFITSSLAPGSNVKCIVISNASCTTSASALSNVINMVVHASPSISISPSGSLIVCAGDSLQLTAGGGTSYRWTDAETTAAIWVHHSGTFGVTGTSSGCSASAPNTAVLTVDSPATPVISQSGNVLTSTTASGYQWILNGTALSGDSVHTLTITQTGSYAVITRSPNGCFAQSATSQFTYVNGISTIGSDLGVKLYPVPNQGSFIVETPALSDADMTIYDIYGQKLYQQHLTTEKTQISGIQLTPAMYLVTVSDHGRTETIKMQVIKE